MIAVSLQNHLNRNCYSALRQPNGAWFCTLLREEWAVAGMDFVWLCMVKVKSCARSSVIYQLHFMSI